MTITPVSTLFRFVSRLGWFVLAALLIAAQIYVPIVIWITKANSRLLGFTASRDYQLFELMGLSGTVFLAILGLIAYFRRADCGRLTGELAAYGLILLSAMAYLYYLTEHSVPMWDYFCYRDAMDAWLAQKNPYKAQNFYLYPPFMAQAFSLVPWAIQKYPWLFRIPAISPYLVFYLTFYIYQDLQFLLILAAGLMSWRLLRQRLSPLAAGVAVAMIFLANAPMFRTLHHNQINLYLLDACLLALLLAPKWPILAGILIGVSIHLKLYPLVLMAPLFFGRRWRALASTIIVTLGIVYFQSSGFHDWTLWQNYQLVMKNFLPRPGIFYRDNSYFGLLYNTFRLHPHGLPATTYLAWTFKGYHSFAFITGLYFLYRMLRRHNFWPFRWKRGVRFAFDDAAQFRLISDWTDMMLMMLLVSPLVWEHHYILAIPPVLWALATVTRRQLFWVALGAALLFVVPVFDLYPISYYRLVGTIILVASTHRQLPAEAALDRSPALIEALRSILPSPPAATERA